MKRIFTSLLLFVLVIFFTKDTLAQKQTNFWHFGTLAGLDFTSGSPVALTNSAITTTEGTATISDAGGNLLFYTDGVQVFDKTNTQMPNGSGLFGDVSTSQTLIVPDPGNNNKYYIFTLDDEAGPNGLNYSIVDMTLNGGNGDVSVKNTHLRNNMTEKVTAVYHCNNHDIWVLTHEMNTDAYVAYLVTDAGVSAPVITNAGVKHLDLHGQMKFNNIGTKVACSISFKDTIQILDFNKSTGIVSNPVTITGPNNSKGFGVEFSPDNSKLYGGFYSSGQSDAFQWDMNAVNIPASEVNLNTNFDAIHRAFQLAPDGKIYISMANGAFLDAINTPNLAGTACGYQTNAINIDPNSMGSMTLIGLPGFVTSYFNSAFPNIPCFAADFNASDRVICQGSCISFTDLSTGTPNKWRWFFSGATIDSSNTQNPPTVCYNSTGQFDVLLIASDISGTDSAFKAGFITVTAADTGGHVTAVRDTICQGSTGNLLLIGNSSNVLQWQSSITTSNFTDVNGQTNSNYITQPLQQTTYYRVAVGTGNCAAFSDTKMLYVPPPLTALFEATVSGKQASFNPDNSIGTIVSYSWTFGDSSATTTDRYPSHTYTRADTFNVCLTIYDGSNCSYTLCKDVIVGMSGIDNVANKGTWQVYPDPITDYLFISGADAKRKIDRIEIYDVLGRIILSENEKVIVNPVKINVSAIPAGAYFLKITSGETNYIQQLIK